MSRIRTFGKTGKEIFVGTTVWGGQERLSLWPQGRMLDACITLDARNAFWLGFNLIKASIRWKLRSST